MGIEGNVKREKRNRKKSMVYWDRMAKRGFNWGTRFFLTDEVHWL